MKKLTSSQKQEEDKKAREDPLNYKRRDPPIYNPIRFAKYLYVKNKSKDMSKSVETPFRETFTKAVYGIPTTAELMRYRQERERAIESEINREAERQFREPTQRPVKRGYEFQILKP